MTVCVLPAEEIEGKKISGSSRNPIKNRGLTNFNNRELYKYIANHNADACVEKPLSEGDVPISESSKKEVGDMLKAEEVSIYSEAKTFKTEVKNKSARHKTNAWVFKKQTLCRISKPHIETINSLKRKLSKG